MTNLNWKVIITAVFCVFLTTACSKKLMPPEIETSGGASSETEFTASSPESSEKDFAGSGGPGDPGFFSEEPIVEQGSSAGSPSAGSSSAGSSSDSAGGLGSSGQDGVIGNGSSGSFDANPFDSAGGMDSGIQESRLQSFQASSDLKDIHFEFDKYDLDSNSRAVLKENAEYLKSNPGLHIEIQGHCDERGTNNYNIALGERRAHSTKQYLVSQGVDSKNVHTISYGEEKPFCFDSNETCWHENRRAHFMVSK